MRHQKRGYRRIVKAGWGSPVLVRGTDVQGRIPVIISTVAEMERLDSKKNCIIISSKVGLKRALVLFEAAKAKKIEVLNLSDEKLSKRKGTRDASIAARESARSEKSKKVKEAEKKSEKVATDKAKVADEDPEEKKRKEKEERDSIITKRES
jgi:large subunit ribosomal protein L32e